MKLLKYKELVPELACSATLGFFDGVHLGHQKLLKALNQKNLPSVVLTFEKPPKTILFPEKKPFLLCSFAEKIQRLSACQVDYVYLLPSTRSFLSQSYKDFLCSIKTFVPFVHLVLGEGAAFGKHRKGTQENIEALGHLWGFSTEYIPPLQSEGKIISSTRIRKLLTSKEKNKGEELLRSNP